jgi:hypothetical protein
MKTFSDSEIQKAVEDYRDFHASKIQLEGLTVEVSRNYLGDTEGVIGFRLSLDSDGHSHGCDETYGIW